MSRFPDGERGEELKNYIVTGLLRLMRKVPYQGDGYCQGSGRLPYDVLQTFQDEIGRFGFSYRLHHQRRQSRMP